MSGSREGHAGPPPGAHLYTRDGFAGQMCVAIRPHTIYGYESVDGPHAPKRMRLADLDLADRTDAEALPTPIAHSRNEVTISVSGRGAPMPYAFRNVERDEMHFVQEGELEYVTDFGTLRVGPGDFIGVGRAVTYRVTPLSGPTLRVIVETPEVVAVDPPAPFGMVNFGRDLRRPRVEPFDGEGQTALWVKSFDGITRFVAPNDPLACTAIVDGVAPVWALNLRAISPLAYPSSGGPPAHFAATPSTDLMLYTLSARPPHGRPPQHHNADYDEIIVYFQGPGAYGQITEPGTLVWTPKGVTHWGPPEDVPEGYWAWLVESRGTMRLTEAAHPTARPMETGEFGVHSLASAAR